MIDLRCGDALQELARLPAGSVRTCITSPPYFGLRDFGHPGQIGLEPTPEAYVARLVEVFRAVRRVLSDDGTLWLNLGDSYATNPGNGRGGEGSGLTKGGKAPHRSGVNRSCLGSKQLLGIPWRVAFALQADGWILRSDIIWAKPNPMPESVRDRPTKAHEYLFLLAKRARYYYYDADAVREPYAMTSWTAETDAKGTTKRGKVGVRSGPKGEARAEGAADGRRLGSTSMMKTYDHGGRNRRSVWTIAARPYKGAHFAVFPPALIEPCIRAGSAPGDTVLDPFCGSGTTGKVAIEQGRGFIGIDLNPAYLELARKRLAAARPVSPLLALEAAGS